MQTSQFSTQQTRVTGRPTRGRNNFVQAEFRPGTRPFRQRVAAEREAAKPKPPQPKVYSSSIPTSTGITGSQARQATSIPTVYRGGGDAASLSRDANAHAMALMGSNQQANTLDQYRQAYQVAGEQARSQDIANQRQHDLDRYGFDIGVNRAQRQQSQQHSRNLRDIQNMRRNAAKGFQSQMMSASLGAVFGSNLLGNLLVPAGQAYAGGARPFGGGILGSLTGFGGGGGGGGGGLFGGLLRR